MITFAPRIVPWRVSLPAAIPEPGTLLLLGGSLASGWAGLRWRRRRAQEAQAEAIDETTEE